MARRAEAKLTLSFPDSETADIVYRALKPDNVPVPRGLKLGAEILGSSVRVDIVSERPLPSLLTTLDDILRMAHLSESTVKALRKT